MRYNQLNEAIIKVPDELLSKVNTYVSSYLYFKIKQYLQRLNMLVSSNTTPEERQRIIDDANTTMGKLQSQYGAKNISADNANNLVNTSIQLKIDVPKFFEELNYKGVTPGLVNILKDRLKFNLVMSTKGAGNNGYQEQSGHYEFLISVVVGNLNAKPSFMKTASDIMNVVYHELQHIVQAVAIKNINRNDKQLQMKDGYHDPDNNNEKYFTSGIEYTPQLGDVVSRVVQELEKSTLSGNLNPDRNKAISAALHKSVADYGESRLFLQHLYVKDRPKYQKAMSTVYKKVAIVYDRFKEEGIDYTNTDLPSEELETSIDVMLSVYKLMYKNEKYKVQSYGKSINNIQQVHLYKDNQWGLVLKKGNRDGEYLVDISSTEHDFDETERLDAKQVMSLFGTLADITWYDAADIIDDIEYITGQRKEVTAESVTNVLESLKSDAMHSDTPFKITGHFEFTVFDRDFVIEKDDSGDKINIKAPNKTYYAWTLKQLLVAFQMLIRFSDSYPSEVRKILDNDDLYIEVMASIRKL